MTNGDRIYSWKKPMIAERTTSLAHQHFPVFFFFWWCENFYANCLSLQIFVFMLTRKWKFYLLSICKTCANVRRQLCGWNMYKICNWIQHGTLFKIPNITIILIPCSVEGIEFFCSFFKSFWFFDFFLVLECRIWLELCIANEDLLMECWPRKIKKCVIIIMWHKTLKSLWKKMSGCGRVERFSNQFLTFRGRQ